MKTYQAIRIAINGKATYGDKYLTIHSDKPLQYNEIVEVGLEKYIVLFEQED